MDDDDKVRRVNRGLMLGAGAVAAIYLFGLAANAGSGGEGLTAAESYFSSTGLDLKDYYVKGGGYSTEWLGLRSTAYTEFVNRTEERDRVTIHVERSPFGGWLLKSIERAESDADDQNDNDK